MNPLLTQPVSAPARHDRDQRPGRSGTARGHAAGAPGPAPTRDEDRPAPSGDGDGVRALATARDALKFRLQAATLPGPGSIAPFLAQQIGQLWIAPDARSNHGYATAAYERANGAADALRGDGVHQPVRI